VRSELFFPDLPGLLTLRCDLHTHTVFSDGNVWPTVRVEEAWRDGLDAIAISDHIEYLPHKTDVSTNRNRPYEIARPRAEALGVLLIRAAEITREEPPGHWNALFLTNCEALNVPDYHDALRIAHEQGAFIFWNHPGWKQPDGKSVWYKEQEEVLQKGWLHGLEIVNGPAYDPTVHQWCVDKGLTPMGNSDVHDPIAFDYGNSPADRRPITLVFAREQSVAGIREALFEGRTAVVCTNGVFGQERFLQPLFEGSVQILNPETTLRGKATYLVQVRNRGAVDLDLELAEQPDGVSAAGRVWVPSGKVVLLAIRGVSEELSGEREVTLPYRVRNFLVTPGQPLRADLRLRIQFLPVVK
jgi:hypothetical protein